MIDLKAVQKTYKGEVSLCALKGIDLHIDKGDFVSITGPSGGGKSTLLNIVGLLDSYDEGLYTLNGTPIKNLSRDKIDAIRNENIGFVFQKYNLLDYKNVFENVELPLIYKGIGRTQRKETVEDLLGKVGLLDRRDSLPSQLSGGQQQRVAIARAMAIRPKILLADEPTGALDSANAAEIMNLFLRMNEEADVTIVMVTHEPSLASRAKRIIRISDGLISGDERLR